MDCPYCNKTYMTARGLENHVRVVHAKLLADQKAAKNLLAEVTAAHSVAVRDANHVQKLLESDPARVIEIVKEALPKAEKMVQQFEVDASKLANGAKVLTVICEMHNCLHRIRSAYDVAVKLTTKNNVYVGCNFTTNILNVPIITDEASVKRITGLLHNSATAYRATTKTPTGKGWSEWLLEVAKRDQATSKDAMALVRLSQHANNVAKLTPHEQAVRSEILRIAGC